MRAVLLFTTFLLQSTVLYSATFGTVVSRPGGAAYSDIAIDEARGNLYLVNPATNNIDIYSLTQKTFLSSISVPGQPVAAAMSRSGKYLYVTAYAASVLYQIDLTTASVASRISVPYHPEGVGVGADERVLITTVVRQLARRPIPCSYSIRMLEARTAWRRST
jgi:DNA-binding beta-propeller fold protein YncE